MPAITRQMVVKLSDEDVIRGVKHEAKIADRSMAGQIEHWVKIGRAVEALTIVRRAGAEGVKAKILSSINQLTISPGRESVQERILARGGPVFQADPSNPGKVIRIMPDGTRATGRIKEGSFVPATARSGR
jgi:hypothetical protein